jgi:nucleoside-diphosphate-sugar epimerase
VSGPDVPRVHVTGGSGFVGGFVIPRLVDEGYQVTALARSERAADRVRELGAEAIIGDLDEAESLAKAFAAAESERLVNIASLGFGHAASIVEAAERAGMRRAVFVSTTAIFTKLNAPSKAVRTAAERTITDSGLQWTIVRPTMIYGTPGDRNMWRLLRLLRRSPLVPAPGGGRNLQQPIHVDDLAQAIVAALDADVAIGRAYDVAGPDPLTFRQVVTTAATAVGRRPRFVPLPGRALVKALQAVERTGRTLPVKAEQEERLLEDKAFDITAARADLGFAPRSFAEGITAEAASAT